MSSATEKKAKLIFERWSADLQSKDRSAPAVMSNFDELFESLYNDEVPFDTVYDMLPSIIKAHYPNDRVARRTFKNRAQTYGSTTYKEFLDDWKKTISDKAHQSFYTFYKIEGEKNKEEKKYGSMSVQEYKRQRDYVERAPILNISELKKQMEDLDLSEFNLEELDGDDRSE